MRQGAEGVERGANIWEGEGAVRKRTGREWEQNGGADCVKQRE